MAKKYLLGAFIICALLLIFHSKENAVKDERPNIVLIVIDALAANHLPFYGYSKNTAPLLASLAEKSVVLENAYSVSSFTAPAMASMFTSFFPTQHGLIYSMPLLKKTQQHNSAIQLPAIPKKMGTITEFLKKKGYRTFGVSQNTNICKGAGFTRGFDIFKILPYEGIDKNGASLNNEILEFRDKAIQSHQPYFLYIHYLDPHHPYHKRSPWYQETGNFLKDLISAYDSEISYVDRLIGRLFRVFDWQKNTLVIITADHGQEFREHGSQGHGNNLYQDVLHVPLLLYFPARFGQGRRISANVSIMDIFPTVQEIIAGRPGKKIIGKSLLPLIAGEPATASDRNIYAHVLRDNNPEELDNDKPTLSRFTAIISGDWKFIKSSRGVELYNLKQDPREKTNLYARYPDLASRLDAQLTDFILGCEPFKPNFTRLPQKEYPLKELKALGYVQ